MRTASPDAELVRRCRKGDRRAQQLLFDQFKGMLMGVCLRYAKDRADADDIFQEAFSRVFHQLDQIRDGERLAGWIRQVAVRCAINHYRQRQRDAWLHVEDVSEHLFGMGEELPLAQLQQEELLQMVQALPDSQRMVFNLVAIEGYSHKEAADMADITESSSRVLLHRARQCLQQQAIALGHYQPSRHV